MLMIPEPIASKSCRELFLRNSDNSHLRIAPHACLRYRPAGVRTTKTKAHKAPHRKKTTEINKRKKHTQHRNQNRGEKQTNKKQKTRKSKPKDKNNLHKYTKRTHMTRNRNWIRCHGKAKLTSDCGAGQKLTMCAWQEERAAAGDGSASQLRKSLKAMAISKKNNKQSNHIQSYKTKKTTKS